jgi:ubiquinone/menaquinone biosynthesis C-methylase UbiE
VSWDDLLKDEFWANWAGRDPLQITLDWIDSLSEFESKRVYDMGCGVGRHTLLLAQRGFEVVASDNSAQALLATRQKLERAGLSAEVLDADMTAIPFPDEHFDAVLAISVLEHNVRSGVETAIAEILRVLRPKGRVLAAFCPRNRWISKDDPELDIIEDNTLRSYGPEETLHHLVDEEELRELFAQFTILSVALQKEEWNGGSSAELFISAQKP